MTTDVEVGEVTAAQTHHLRRLVLRASDPDAVVEWAGDDEASTFHLGGVVGGSVAAISTWLVAPDPLAPSRRAMRLRGMATHPDHVGIGLGRALLGAGVERAATTGAERVWANARVSAVGFYTAARWLATGAVFETESTGLPHRHVHIDLTWRRSALSSPRERSPQT